MAVSPPARPRNDAVDIGRPSTMLALATVGFAICFWAWALIGPLGSDYAAELDLSAVQQSFLVAVPVIVGSIGRIPVGAMTDRFGARTMFPAVAGLTILPVLFVGLVADNYPLLIVGGFFLGLGGTAFAVGVPFVNAWYPPHRRGLALGIFGAGMGGTAISAFSTVQIADVWGREAPFLIVAVALAAYAMVARMVLRDAGARSTRASSFARRVWHTFIRPVTLQLSLLYAVGFGGFVAFSVYLPTYLTNAYGLDEGDAALRTAGFVILAVVMRPVAGYLSDRLGPVTVLIWSFLAATVLAVIAAMELDLVPTATVAFLGLAAALGAVSGAVFALVAERVAAPEVGSVTGVVGAAGGLGGFVPPLIMGTVYGAFGEYLVGLLLLAAMALFAGMFTARVFGPIRRESPGGDRP